MADHPRVPDEAELPKAVSGGGRRWTPQLIWVIPIVAVLVGGWLAVKTILERGPEITIRFKTAEGLEAGKTKIKYKDVEIGTVKTITLTEDRKGIVAKAQLAKEAEEFLVEDTKFFVVRPRVTAAGISGLGTLLSGPYIGIDIGRSKQARRNFIGLDEAPIVTSSDPGREFVLRAEDVGSIEVGTNIYFRRLFVGEVVSLQLDKDGKGVTFKVFIHAPYDQFITEHTRFWNASGIDVAIDATGIQVHTESLAAILVGGITFGTRPDAPLGSPAAANTVFTLFADRTQALKRPDLVVDRYLLVFDGSVRGLSVGAPVDFRGLTVGEVTRIGVAIDPKTLVFTMPVEIFLFPDRLQARHFIGGMLPPPGSEAVRRARVRQLIDHGLRAQLRSGNLLTGQQYVALDFFPDVPKVKPDPSKVPPEIPTLPGTFEELQNTIASIAKKLDKIEYEKLDADIRTLLASLDQTLKGVDGFLKSLDTDVLPDLKRALEDASRTLKTADTLAGSMSADSPIQADLRDALRELTRALVSVRALADYLQRHPESLIRGKPPQGE